MKEEMWENFGMPPYSDIKHTTSPHFNQTRTQTQTETYSLRSTRCRDIFGPSLGRMLQKHNKTSNSSMYKLELCLQTWLAAICAVVTQADLGFSLTSALLFDSEPTPSSLVTSSGFSDQTQTTDSSQQHRKNNTLQA